MIPPELVSETVKYLTPALPSLILAGNEALKEIGKKVGAEAIAAGEKIWAWLKPHAEQRLPLLEAAQEVATHPADTDGQAALRVQVRKLLEEHPGLVPELANVVQQIAVQRNVVDVSGAGAVGIWGNASGVTITTNVQR